MRPIPTLALLAALSGLAGARALAAPPVTPAPPATPVPSLAAPVPSLATPLVTPEQLADLVVVAHPELEAARARLAAARAQAGVAGALPDPMLGLEYMHRMPGRVGDAQEGGLALMARQELPLPGVRAARVDAAAAGLAVVEADRAEVEAALVAEVHAAWWALSLVRARRGVDQEHLARLAELEAVVRSRYETGEAGASAVLRVELLRDELALELRDLDVEEATLVAALARAASLGEVAGAGADAGLGAWVQPAAPSPVAVSGTPTQWLDRAARTRPALLARAAEAETMRQMARVARRDGWSMPALEAGLETGMGGGGPLYRVGVELPLALSSGRVGRAMEGAALQQAAQAEAMQRALLDELRASLESAHAAWTVAAERALALQERLLPLAARTMEATLADYRVGRAPFAELVDAELALLALERARLQAATETRLQHARVAGLLGLAPGAL